MTNMAEPRRAVDHDDVASSDAMPDGELTTLVRRWMAAGTRVQERVRRDSNLRVAPDLDTVEPEPVEPEAVEPAATLVGFPRLPQRPMAGEAEQVHRVALLIDARRIPAGVASALLARLAERGAVNVCRAYADWDSSRLGEWVGHMRREGLHSFHHFSDDDDQALVAMAIDAVDIARDAAVDEVVVAGDLTSALPLVHRLHAAGVRVVAVGSGLTPHDVRAAAHEFIDTATLDGARVVPVGRHRA